jgi:hypothetical protein
MVLAKLIYNFDKEVLDELTPPQEAELFPVTLLYFLNRLPQAATSLHLQP